MILQNFIVFEGIDGAGTSTQLSLLRERPGTEKYLFTSEPTSAPTGKFLRQMLKGDFPVKNETSAYLFAADRNEHINGSLVTDGDRHLVTGVREACQSGHIVVSDRYLFSSLAYQSIDCPPDVPRALNSFFPLPQLLFYFEIEPEVSLSRIDGRGVREIYEKTDFLNKTVAAYHQVMDEFRGEKGNGMRIVTVDATLPVDTVRNLIWNEIDSLS